VVDGDHAMAFRQKPIHQMRPEKTRASGDNRNGLGTFGHCGCVLIVAGDVYQKEVRYGGITNNCRAFDSSPPAPSPVRDARLWSSAPADSILRNAPASDTDALQVSFVISH